MLIAFIYTAWLVVLFLMVPPTRTATRITAALCVAAIVTLWVLVIQGRA
jgi:hypothetical protein